MGRSARAARRRLLACLIVVTAVSTGCSSSEKDIQVTLEEYSLHAEPTATDSGAVKLFIDNLGDEPHDLVLLRAKDPAELPTLPNGAVDLETASIADRVPVFDPGAFESVFHNVRKGTYVLVCNLVTDGVSHFQQGMRQVITVRESDFDRAVFD